MNESKRRARYTLKFKLEAVRLVKGGQVAAATAKFLLWRFPISGIDTLQYTPDKVEVEKESES